MKQVKCIVNRFVGQGDPEFTVGRVYDMDFTDRIYGDDGKEWYLDENLCYAGFPHMAQFMLVEDSPAVSDEYEEEEFRRLEKNTRVSQDLQAEQACCDVALAYQLSQLQKFLRDSGSNIELVVHQDLIAINDENCREYRGNVEQILRYIKISGKLAKVADEMDRRS